MDLGRVVAFGRSTRKKAHQWAAERKVDDYGAYAYCLSCPAKKRPARRAAFRVIDGGGRLRATLRLVP